MILFDGVDTTRLPRPGESNGKEYHFVTREQFLDLVNEGGFIEHAEFSKNLYGTSVKAVRDVADLGRRCILDIDAQVLLQLTFLLLSSSLPCKKRYLLLALMTSTTFL